MAATKAGMRTMRARSSDWITPPYIIKALGRFDLDPCCCTPQPWKTASRMYSKREDGFSKEWGGRVWLNPPYGAECERWMERLAEHGHGTALIFARTEVKWFVRHVWDKADAILFLFGRVHFFTPDGQKAIYTGGPSVLVAYGDGDAEDLYTSGLAGRFFKLK